MAEVKFNSNLSEAEIENNFKDIDYYSEIMSGLEEVLAYEKGTARAAAFAQKKGWQDVNVVKIRKIK